MSNFKPLHERIAEAKGFNEATKAEADKAMLQVRSDFKIVGDTPEGQRVMDWMINKFIMTSPERGMSAEDVMFMAGQESVVKMFVLLASRGEKND